MDSIGGSLYLNFVRRGGGHQKFGYESKSQPPPDT